MIIKGEKDIQDWTYRQYIMLCENYFLYESMHVTEAFNDFIEDIIRNIQSYDKEQKYTGWNFFNVSQNGKIEVKQLNNASIAHPIYLCIYMDEYGPYGYVKERTAQLKPTDPIYICINDFVFNEPHYDVIIRSVLQHECLHVLKSYASDSTSLLKTNKELIAEITDDFGLTPVKGTSSLFMYFQEVMPYFSPNEQDALLNGMIKYLNQQSDNDIISMFDKKRPISIWNKVDDIITSTLNYNRLDILKDIIAQLKEYNRIGFYLRTLIIGYYLDKHKVKLFNSDFITVSFIKVYMNNHQKYPYEEGYDKLLEVVKDIMNELDDLYIKYKKRLADAVFKLLTDRKLTYK